MSSPKAEDLGAAKKNRGGQVTFRTKPDQKARDAQIERMIRAKVEQALRLLVEPARPGGKEKGPRRSEPTGA